MQNVPNNITLATVRVSDANWSEGMPYCDITVAWGGEARFIGTFDAAWRIYDFAGDFAGRIPAYALATMFAQCDAQAAVWDAYTDAAHDEWMSKNGR